MISVLGLRLLAFDVPVLVSLRCDNTTHLILCIKCIGILVSTYASLDLSSDNRKVLCTNKPSVMGVKRKEVIMGALLNDLPIREDHDAISVPDSGKSMGDNKCRPLLRNA
ncbi:hypothetical protein HG531_012881 [Fusarium graminearum]|nr:hypothetical protein HG531_012881 [Fusarium graminearum]